MAEVGAELRAAPHLLLGLDFDGTLAPIVPRPENARMPDDTRSTLEALTPRPDITIAVVSGRGMPDLVSRVDLNIILAANHGLEIAGGGLNFRYPPAENRQKLLHRICRAIARQSEKIPGVLIEDKDLTASVHFRGVSESGRNELFPIVRAALETVQDRFDARRGKEVIEIVPRVSWNKGSAVLWILEQLRSRLEIRAVSVCYIGDDATDEDVFRAIDGVTICVGDYAPTSARFGVRDAVEAANFLRWLSSTPFSTRSLKPTQNSSDSTQPSGYR